MNCSTQNVSNHGHTCFFKHARPCLIMVYDKLSHSTEQHEVCGKLQNEEIANHIFIGSQELEPALNTF